MTARSYKRTTNILTVITLAAAYIHDHVGSYAWLTMALAALGGVGVGAVGFYYRWWQDPSSAGSEDGADQDRDRLASDVDRPI